MQKMGRPCEEMKFKLHKLKIQQQLLQKTLRALVDSAALARSRTWRDDDTDAELRTLRIIRL